jgi:hypothetical protein
LKAYHLLQQFVEIVNLEEQQTNTAFGHSAMLKEIINEKVEEFSANFDAYVKNLTCPKPIAQQSIWKDVPS